MDKELKDQIKLVFELLADPETTEAIATMCWNLYVDLKKKGFTEDQAIAIVVNMAGKTNK